MMNYKLDLLPCGRMPPLTNQVAVYIISSQTCIIYVVTEREPGHMFLLQAQSEQNQRGCNIKMLLKIHFRKTRFGNKNIKNY